MFVGCSWSGLFRIMICQYASFLHIFVTVDWAKFPSVFLNRLKPGGGDPSVRSPVLAGWWLGGRVADVPGASLAPAVLRIVYNVHSNR